MECREGNLSRVGCYVNLLYSFDLFSFWTFAFFSFLILYWYRSDVHLCVTGLGRKVFCLDGVLFCEKVFTLGLFLAIWGSCLVGVVEMGEFLFLGMGSISSWLVCFSLLAQRS